MAEVQIRLIKEGDVDEYLATRKISWQTTYPNADYNISLQDLDSWFTQETNKEAKAKVLKAIKNGQDDGLDVMFLDNKIIGAVYLTDEVLDDQKWGKVKMIYIIPDYIGKGFGRRLMQHALDKLKKKGFDKVLLTTQVYNQRATDFYAGFGFEIDPRKVEGFKLSETKTIPHIRMLKKGI